MQGYFFCADLLGFGCIVKNLTKDDLRKRIDRWVDFSTAAAEQAGIEHLQLISDTVFAATSESGLAALVSFARILLTDGIQQHLPIRGAITRGEFEFGKLTYGPAVVAAHTLEKNQDWIGVSCAFGMQIPKELWGPTSLVCYPAPLKRGVVGFQPVVPRMDDLNRLSSGGGLVKEGEMLQWQQAHKAQNTIQFGMYLRYLIKVGGFGDRFLSDFLPMKIIEEKMT